MTEQTPPVAHVVLRRAQSGRPWWTLRMVDADGAVHDESPTADPLVARDYEGLAWARNRDAGVLQPQVLWVTSPAGDCALWDHGESSNQAHRYTLVLPAEVEGRRLIPLLQARLDLGPEWREGVIFASYAQTVTHRIDLAERTVSWQRGETTGEGWPDLSDQLGVPLVTWLEPLEAVVAELDRLASPEGRHLLLVRAHLALAAWADREGHPVLAAAARELAAADDPPRS